MWSHPTDRLGARSFRASVALPFDGIRKGRSEPIFQSSLRATVRTLSFMGVFFGYQRFDQTKDVLDDGTRHKQAGLQSVPIFRLLKEYIVASVSLLSICYTR
jgi:hypothetical protein